MWRDRLDVFWDGRRTLALGVFDAEAGGAPDLAVFAARDVSFADAALLDFVEARQWRRGGSVLDLPKGYAFVSVCAADGAEARFALGDDEASTSGEWRLLLVEEAAATEAARVVFRTAHLSARGDLERLTREEIAGSGSKLVWAISQRRRKTAMGFEADGEAPLPLVRLSPAQMAYPTQQSRLIVEALEILTQQRLAPLKAPFAVMEHWLSEAGAPMATLRLRFPGLDQSEAFLSRVSVVLVMHQRRRLRAQNAEQRRLGGAVTDALTLGDIRHATGSQQEKPDAAVGGAPIIVHNLLKLVTGGVAEFDGVSLRRRPNGASDMSVAVEIDFYGAALGDDIGLVSAGADAGDFGVVPEDPGGARYVRLFRIERDGLAPRRIEEDDPLLEEILRIAEASEGAGVGGGARSGEKTLGAQARREKLVVELNSALAAADFDRRLTPEKIWEVFEPSLMAQFVALIENAAPLGRVFLHKIGGFSAFRADPALVRALVRQQEFPPSLSETSLRELRLASPSLVYRYLAALGLSRVLAQGVEAAAQSASWRLFMLPPQAGLAGTAFARRLAATHIVLDGGDNLERKAAHVTRSLADEAMVERAAIWCEDQHHQQQGEALRDYLLRRREGEWTLLQDAEILARIVDEADAYWREVEHGAHPAAPPAAETHEPASLLARVRSFFTGGG